MEPVPNRANDPKRVAGPKSVESGLPLNEELKQAGILEGEDAENYVMHYGDGGMDKAHIQPNNYKGGFEVAYCGKSHSAPAECAECEWQGKMSSAPYRGYSHTCPSCHSDSIY